MTLLILSIILSIDALGIGIAYGIRNIRLTPCAVVIISVTAFIFSFVSVLTGKFFLIFLPDFFSKLIGVILLSMMGICFIFQGIPKRKRHKKKNIFSSILPKKIRSYSCGIFSLIIGILKTPEVSDIDNSGKIESKEALYLGIALSIDILTAGIGISSLGVDSLMIPIYIAFFQFVFLCMGVFIGSKIIHRNINDNVCMIISGMILIIIAFFHIIS